MHPCNPTTAWPIALHVFIKTGLRTNAQLGIYEIQSLSLVHFFPPVVHVVMNINGITHVDL